MFHKARIKLTLWYVVMIMTLSLIFSVTIYQLQLRELRLIEVRQKTRIYRQLESQKMAPLILELSFIDEAKNNLIINLFYLNGIIFVLSGMIAWLLSGKTLAPIHAMVLEQSRFISDASHELKTPLTSLKTAFEVFARSKKKSLKEADRIIRESIDEVDRLQELTSALLQLAQSQKPLAHHVFENTSLLAILKNARKKITPLAQKKKIAINIAGKNVYAAIITDEITNLFMVLFENAIKYSPEKSTIRVSLATKRTEVLISIRDQGVGIAKEDLPYIFDRFYRADTARTHKGSSGYGLGLSIAQHIVKKHNGSISVESSLNTGTTFTVRIPKKQPLS